MESLRSDNIKLNKSRINQQIANLKQDIQYLIDNKNTLIQTNGLDAYNIDKQKKMTTIKELNDQLKTLHYKEKERIKIQNEITRISKTIDNLEFAGAKNNKTRMMTAKQAKQQREVSKQQYLEYLKLEESYFKFDPINIPGYIFLHQDVLDTYGLCPYVLIKKEEDMNTEHILEQRQHWLQSQQDNGETYFDLYKTLILKDHITDLYKHKELLETQIHDFATSVMSPTQLELYNECLDIIKEYCHTTIKTKRLKERFKILINKMSILFGETGMSLHNYFSIKYNLTISVNDIFQENDKLTTFYNSTHIESYITDYQQTIDSIQTKEKYITNTIKNLKNELYLFMTDQKKFISKTTPITQFGKYFKRWILLSEEEKLERFENFCTFYIQKNMVQEGILNEELKFDKIDELTKLILDAYNSKQMVYRDYTWNANKGIIEKIKILRYDRDLDKFFLKFTKIQHNNTQKEQAKRNVSVQSIFTKENEPIINEELLYFILKGRQETISKDDKNDFLNHLKTKLRLKKITSNDKTTIFNKYDEVFNVIKNNKQ